MTTRTQKISVSVLALAGIATLVWLAFHRREASSVAAPLAHAPATPAVAATAPSPRAVEPVAAAADTPPSTTRAVEMPAAPVQPAAVVVQPSVPASVRNEAAATARMYAAHASLRTPDVADPDSKANRQILQTMVFKALARSSSAPPSAVSAKP